VLIEQQHLLARQFGRIIIPPAVFLELSSDSAPVKVRRWANTLPRWIVVSEPVPMRTELERLDSGEAEAISLAMKLAADVLLIDEQKGRTAATALGLRLSGTLGVLRDAHNDGLVDGRLQYDLLRSTTFRSSPSLERDFSRSLTRR
jgi:predicted nucleic acid-binding protein